MKLPQTRPGGRGNRRARDGADRGRGGDGDRETTPAHLWDVRDPAVSFRVLPDLGHRFARHLAAAWAARGLPRPEGDQPAAADT
jgi:hypothetical protein